MNGFGGGESLVHVGGGVQPDPGVVVRVVVAIDEVGDEGPRVADGPEAFGEQGYSQEDDFELLESARNWSANKSLLSTYPDSRSRIDEHLMDFLANARHAENVAETFTSAEDSGQTMTVTVDGDAVEAELWGYGEERAIAFTIEPLTVTYVLPLDADTASCINKSE